MKGYFSLLLLSAAISAEAQQQPLQLWFDEPAKYFEESLPLGNGRLGALVYGNPQEDMSS